MFLYLFLTYMLEPYRQSSSRVYQCNLTTLLMCIALFSELEYQSRLKFAMEPLLLATQTFS